MVDYMGRQYSSKKHPMLEVIFKKYNPNNDISLKSISFTLQDISDAYKECRISEPASISNTILDLTRKKSSVSARLPESIYSLGYDLQKRTGTNLNGGSYAGEFIYVGIGNQIQSWLTWPDNIEEVVISSKAIPTPILTLLRKDEGALFSVIDYCDVFSKVLYSGKQKIMRVQNPMKWQPNEIDGFYFAEVEGQHTFFPVEAKALTTKDDINLVQLKGGVSTVITKLYKKHIEIIPLAAQMVTNGINIGIFKKYDGSEESYTPELVTAVKVVFDPIIESWR